MNTLSKAVLITSVLVGCSFASGARIPDIMVNTLPSVWEAIDEDHLCVYQLEIYPDLSGCLVVAKEDELDVYEICGIEIIPRDDQPELMIELKNEERSVRLRGTGWACDSQGCLMLGFYKDPGDKLLVSELAFVKPLHDTPSMERFHNLSHQACEARKVKWESVESNISLSASVPALPKVARETLPGLWEAMTYRGPRVYQLEIHPDGQGILVYSTAYVDHAYTCWLKKIEVVEKDETQELSLVFVKEDGSLVSLTGIGKPSNTTGGLDFQFDINPLGKPHAWDLHFMKCDNSSYVQNFYELSQRAYRARYLEWEKRDLRDVEIIVEAKVKVEVRRVEDHQYEVP